jgi:hypothetical protein
MVKPANMFEIYVVFELWKRKKMTRAKHVLSKAEGTQSTPSSEKSEDIFSLRSWRLGGINCLEMVLFSI